MGHEMPKLRGIWPMLVPMVPLSKSMRNWNRKNTIIDELPDVQDKMLRLLACVGPYQISRNFRRLCAAVLEHKRNENGAHADGKRGVWRMVFVWAIGRIYSIFKHPFFEPKYEML